jgi:hypothetical protein
LSTFAENSWAVLAGHGPLDALDPFPGMVFVFRAKPANHVDESVRNKTE